MLGFGPMTTPMTRRHFIQTTASAAALAAIGAPLRAASGPNDFSFVLFGDLHLDRLEHHDMAWLEAKHPGDVSQVKNYSRICAEVTPKLFDAARGTIGGLRKETAVPFTLQVGDFVEGLCGNLKLARTHCEHGISYVEQAKFGTPFLFTKGNHDVTGDGAVDAFDNILVPYLHTQLGTLKNVTKPVASSNYAFEHHGVQFAFFDAYNKASLDALEKNLAASTAKVRFVIAHPPVVPYGARVTWHVYSKTEQTDQRTRLLNLLGQYNAIVLGGHIHRYNCMARDTAKGRFVQLAVSSILSQPDMKAKYELNGVKEYSPEQLKVEPNYGKGTEDERSAVIKSEAPQVKYFEYAELPGYAVIHVRGGKVQAEIHAGVSRQAWKTVDLSKLFTV
jgi:hypothetical protein